MRLRDLADDREPEPAPASRPRARLVGAPEAVEDPLPMLGGDAGAVVGDGEPRPAVELAVREADARALGRDADGVVEQVRDRPLEHVPVALDDPARNDGGLERHGAGGCRRRELLARVLEQCPERNGLAAGCGRVEAGQREQIVGQPRHPVDRALDHRRRRGSALVGRLGVGEGEVEIGLDDRERRPQLVRGVGDEAPLRREGEVESRQHRVERVREPLQLVVGPVELDPPRQLARLDLARHACDVRDRREHPPGDHPADSEAGHEERARARRARSVRRLRSVRSFT